MAVVTTIGLVTVTALIGQGGLGSLILQGIQQFFSTPLIIGAVLSIALAVLLDGALVLVQRRVTPWTRDAGVNFLRRRAPPGWPIRATGVGTDGIPNRVARAPAAVGADRAGRGR